MNYHPQQVEAVPPHDRSYSSSADPPKELVVGFWTLVLLLKLAILAIGVGVIVLIFTDVLVLGGALVIVGIIVLIRWILTYRSLREQYDIA